MLYLQYKIKGGTNVKHVKSIEFAFENCEYFTIDAKYFGALWLSGINTCIQRIACNSISKMECVDDIAMMIFSEGDDKYTFFREDSDMTKFNRLNTWKDISSITVIYDDDSKEEYYVEYEDEVEGQLGSNNILQRNYMNKFGDLYIVISKKKAFSDFFDDDEMDDEDTIKFAKDMILY